MAGIEVFRPTKSLVLFISLITFNYCKIYSIFKMIPNDRREIKAGSFEKHGVFLVDKIFHLDSLMQTYKQFIKPMLYSHIIAPLCLFGLLAIVFLVYTGVIWCQKKVERIEMPNVLHYFFVSWVLVSPIYTALYCTVFYELNTFAQKRPDYLNTCQI